jgi:NAD(P)-dependent dehydrogenase (short-subunit alcohol dehydrogenase family)
VGLYCASKACAGILSEALRAEVAHLGITVTAIEPGYFRTDFLAQGHKVCAERHIDELDQGTAGMQGALAAYNHQQPGDPVKAAKLIVEGLTGIGRCEGRELPARWLIGSDAHQFVTAVIDEQRKVMDQWKDLTTTTDCDA